MPPRFGLFVLPNPIKEKGFDTKVSMYVGKQEKQWCNLHIVRTIWLMKNYDKESFAEKREKRET